MFNFLDFNKKHNEKFTVVWKAVQGGIKQLSKVEILEIDIVDLVNILKDLYGSTDDPQCMRYYCLISLTIVKIQKAKADLLLNDVIKLENNMIDVEEIRAQIKMPPPPPPPQRGPITTGVRDSIESAQQPGEVVPQWIFNLEQSLFEDHVLNIEMDLQERLAERERTKEMLIMEEEISIKIPITGEFERPILDQQELTDIIDELKLPQVEDVPQEVIDVQMEAVPVQQEVTAEEVVPEQQEAVVQQQDVEPIVEPTEIRPTKRTKTDRIRKKLHRRRIHVLNLINRNVFDGHEEQINETLENAPEIVIDETIRQLLQTTFRDIVEYTDDRIRRIDSRVTSSSHVDVPTIHHERTPSIIDRKTTILKTPLIEQLVEVEEIEHISPPQQVVKAKLHESRQHQLANQIRNLQDGECLTLEEMANEPICRYTKALTFTDITDIIYELPAIMVNYDNSSAFKHVQRISSL